MSLSTTEYSRAVEVDENRLQDVELNEESKDNATQGSATMEAATTASDEDEPALTEEELKARCSSRNKKILIGLLLVAFVVFVIVDAFTTGYVRSGIDSFLAWIEANPVPGFFVFMIVYVVATIIFVPGSILTLGAGFVFANAFGLGIGVLLGALSVFFGATAGAIVAFLLGRYLLRDWVKTLTKKYVIFEALDTALDQKGFHIMALLRLSPIIPFNAINYIAGVTAVSLRAYCLSLIAILPGTTLYVFLGASAGSLADSASSGDNTTLTIVVVVVGAILGIGAIILTSYSAKKELNRVIAERETATAAALDVEEEVDLEATHHQDEEKSPAEADIPVVVE